MTSATGLGISAQPTTWQRFGPALMLIVLAPVVAEVLSGATRISYIFVIVPEMMVWGCGALLIRETVVRWRGGWHSLLLLGLALSVAEEFIIQQTSIAPLPWLGSAPTYGRFWGVNWIYFLFMLGYESVWVVLVPIQLVNLIFPRRRGERWLHKTGLAVSGAAFLLGSFIAWLAWTQRARTNVFHMPEYQPPVELVLLGLTAIIVLVLLAYRCRTCVAEVTVRHASPHPGLVAGATLVLGLPWYVLMTLTFAPRTAVPVWAVILGSVCWATLAATVIGRWSSSSKWEDMHRWAIVFGAILVCMGAGFSGSSAWPRIDIIGKAILNVLAITLLFILGISTHRRASA